MSAPVAGAPAESAIHQLAQSSLASDKMHSFHYATSLPCASSDTAAERFFIGSLGCRTGSRNLDRCLTAGIRCGPDTDSLKMNRCDDNQAREAVVEEYRVAQLYMIK